MIKQRDRAAKELTRRSLIEFTQYTHSAYVVDPFHAMIASYLDKVVKGKLDRLMIFAPPQHGKSELVSVRLPAYWFGKRPDDPVILGSYAAALAHNKSRHARAVVESDLYPFDVKTNPASRAVEHWELDGYCGGLRAQGVGGGIAGNPAMLGIIDDPVASWQEAQSQTYRDRAWEWWRNDFYPRVWEGGAIVVIQTRWHEDDLSGRILQHEADRWTVLRCPAIAETQEQRDYHNARMGLPAGLADPLNRDEGEPLSPSRFSLDALKDTKKTVGSRVWQALYQGAPTAIEGNRFKRDWFTIVDAVPANIAQRTRYWDLAATESGGARTAGVLLAISDGVVYVEDVQFGQWGTGKRNKIMKQIAELDHQRYGNRGRLYFEQEPGSSGVDAARAIIQYLAGFAVAADRATGAKDTRLEPFAAQAEAGNVRLVRGNWNTAYIDEMCAVPNGQFRDMADATAGGYNRLAGSHAEVVNLGRALAERKRGL